MNSDLYKSFVRTVVPIIVGTILAINLGGDLSLGDFLSPESVTAVVSGIIGAIYYIVARILEAQTKVGGYLLGIPQAPTYRAPEDIELGVEERYSTDEI